MKNLANDTGGSQTLSIELVGNSEQSDESEAFHFVFEVRAGQPGNNWQVAVHDERDVINRGYAHESTSQVGDQPDGKTLLRSGTAAPAFVSENLKTDIVTAHRTLWIEHDVMDDPDKQPNQTLRGVIDGEPGCNGCDDPKAFDTSLDLGVLEELLEVASVRVRVLEPGDEGYNRRNVIPFVRYVPYLPNESIAGTHIQPYQDVRSREDFWNVHLVSGYEADKRKDNDPDSIFSPLNWTLGYCFFIGQAAGGPTMLYHEEIRDVLASPRNEGLAFRSNFTAVVTAHEILHRFFGNHNQNPAVNHVGIMDWQTALLQTDEPLELTDLQLQHVQTRDFPR